MKQLIYERLIQSGMTPAGACGLMGNLYAESGLKCNVVERLCLKRLKEQGKGEWTDESYTAAVDSGAITREEFLNPLPGKRYGYGLCQWTTEGRKAGLYDLCKHKGASIADPESQIEWMLGELKSTYKTVWKTLEAAEDVREASDIVLDKFERPADRSESVRAKRASYGQKYFDEFAKEEDMAVLIGSARSNEKGGINGGNGGDQTGGEVSTQNWYLHSKGWIVIRPKKTETAETIARTMEGLCSNDNFGYCQDHRLGGYNAAKEVNFDVAKVAKKVEIDCSEAVRISIAAAGIHVADFYTGNEEDVLKATGEFEIIKDSKICGSSDYLLRGDILVTRKKGHTAVVLSDGAKAAKSDPVKQGWLRAADGIRWWYQNADGTYPANGWKLIDHHWFLFDDDGYMLTGWQQWDGQHIGSGDWYYLCETRDRTEGQCWHEARGGKGALEPWYVD